MSPMDDDWPGIEAAKAHAFMMWASTARVPVVRLTTGSLRSELRGLQKNVAMVRAEIQMFMKRFRDEKLTCCPGCAFGGAGSRWHHITMRERRLERRIIEVMVRLARDGVGPS